MDHEARKTEFLDRLYAAAVGADAWKPVLESYTRLVGGHASLLSFYDIPAGTVRTLEWHNFSEDYISASNAHWKAFNPWSVAGQQLLRDPHAVGTGGFVSAGSSLVPHHELLKTEWYNEFAAGHGVQDCLTTVGLSGGAKGLALIANTGGRPSETYTSEQVALAASVLKDVQRAMTLHLKSTAGAQTQPASSSYASMTLPVLVTKERLVITANVPAEQELERGRLVRSQGGRLVILDPELARMLVAVARKDENHQMAVVATATDGRRFLAQAVRFNQLRGTLMAAAGADDPAVMLVLTALDQGAAGREAAIRALGCFTPVEQAIAVALVNGQSAEEIARERRTSVLTIRWHLRNMSDKTGQSGSKALMRMLTLLLPY